MEIIGFSVVEPMNLIVPLSSACLAPSVAFIQKQESFLSVKAQIIFGLGNDLANFFNSGRHGIKLYKVRTRCVCDY